MGFLSLFALSILLTIGQGVELVRRDNVTSAHQPSTNEIPLSTRVHWMREANAALSALDGTPCPFGAFASAIVNHTVPGLGDLVCIGVNSNAQTGNPTLHGEIAAIQNCTTVLTDPRGRFKLTPSEALNAFSQLSLYTNAESCPMCASAIRWAGFSEYIFGTTIDTLVEQGWTQIRISSVDVFRQSSDLGTQTRLIGNILTNETDPLFQWQFNSQSPCPRGCARSAGTCAIRS